MKLRHSFLLPVALLLLALCGTAHADTGDVYVEWRYPQGSGAPFVRSLSVVGATVLAQRVNGADYGYVLIRPVVARCWQVAVVTDVGPFGRHDLAGCGGVAYLADVRTPSAMAAKLRQRQTPHIDVTWQPGGAAVVAWSGAPAGACVEAHRPGGLVVRLEPCGAAQTVSLAAGGVDTAYAPRGGAVYVLAWHGAALAQATLPRIETALPRSVAP